MATPAPGAEGGRGLDKLWNRLLLSLAFGFLVVLALGFFADIHRTLRVLSSFDWQWLPAILGLTLLNYLGRYVKWSYYLGCIGSHVSRRDSAAIFLAGLSMVMTPGKVGELLKSYLLRRIDGTPIARSAPIVLAERLTDGVALLILGAAGLALYGMGWELMALVAVAAATFIVLIQSSRLACAAIRGFGRLPGVGRLSPKLLEAYQSMRTLLGTGNLALAIGIGLLSWSGECLAFALVLHGLRVDTALLVVKSAFILSASTLVGSASLLPGGLGVADGGIALLVRALVTPDITVAVAAALLIRLCTLWFGVAIGIVALASLSRRLGGRAALERLPQP